MQPFIDKAEIRTLIPHAGSMCLLDRVIAWDERSILCASETQRDPANPLRRDGHLSAIHAFEYGAQAVAAHGGLRARAAGAIAPPGYLAALRNATLHAQQLDGFTSPLQIEAERLFADTANSVYECRISAGNMLLAHGRVTIILRTPSETTSTSSWRDGRRPVPKMVDGHITGERVIASDHPSLAGHFPGEPIVPGVVILDEVIAALAEFRHCPVVLHQISAVKFLGPLSPEELFTISFSGANPEPTDFQCRAEERVIAQGRLELTSHD